MPVVSPFGSAFVTRPMLGRSLLTAVVVGGLLFTVNHDRAVLLQAWTALMWRQLGVSMVVPFVVSFTSAVLMRREMLAGPTKQGPSSGQR